MEEGVVGFQSPKLASRKTGLGFCQVGSAKFETLLCPEEIFPSIQLRGKRRVANPKSQLEYIL